jgi:hypothetical protein
MLRNAGNPAIAFAWARVAGTFAVQILRRAFNDARGDLRGMFWRATRSMAVARYNRNRARRVSRARHDGEFHCAMLRARSGAWRNASAATGKPRGPLYPLPEALAPGPWVINHTKRGGSTSRASKTLIAPLDNSPISRGIRCHELLHLGCPGAPAKALPGRYHVSMDTYLAAEDMRVNLWGTRNDLADTLAPINFTEQELGGIDPRINLRHAVLMAVASTGYATAASQLRAHLNQFGDVADIVWRIHSRCVRIMRRAGYDKHAATVQTARYLDKLFGNVPDGELPEGIGKLAGEIGNDENDNAQWANMEIINAPLPVSHVPRTGRKRTLSEEGIVPVQFWRVDLDGKIFQTDKRAQHGTTLIDGSGSMHLDGAMMARVIDVCPSGIIAVYNGPKFSPTGQLRIIARKGRRASDEYINDATGHFNIIDGPALRWLAKQKGPRVWISDGCVNGRNGETSDAMIIDAMAVCSGAGIVRVPDVDAAVAYFKRARKR